MELNKRTVTAIFSIALLFIGGSTALAINNNNAAAPPNRPAKARNLTSQEHQSSGKDKIDDAFKMGFISASTQKLLSEKYDQLTQESEILQSTFKDKTRTEKLSIIEQKQLAINEWEKANDVPTGYLFVLNPFN